MKLELLAIMFLIASCAPSQSSRSGPASNSGSSVSGSAAGSTRSSGIDSPTPAANSYSQDAVECERKAALSQAGGKGEAFASCMRSREHTPGRP
jgi:ABC-type phosphate transport system substrate-binding protein